MQDDQQGLMVQNEIFFCRMRINCCRVTNSFWMTKNRRFLAANNYMYVIYI
jgi:hypothetical protein